MANINNSAGMHFAAFALTDRLRRLVILVLFAIGLAGGIYADAFWVRFTLFAIAACAGLVMLVELFTRLLSACVAGTKA